MPKVNDNEKRLLTALGIVAFLAANVFGYLFISGVMKSMDAQKKQLTERLRSLDRARDAAPEADSKAEWMALHFKAYPDDVFRETYLDGLVNSELTSGLDVDLSKPTVLPTDFSSQFCVRSKFRVNVKGPWTDVWKFVYRLQKPAEFRFVPRITVMPKKSETDDSVQLAEVQVEIEKWWPKPDGEAFEPENSLQQNEQPAGGAVNASDVNASTPPPPPSGEPTETSAIPADAAKPPVTPSAPATETPPASSPENNSPKPKPNL